MKCSSSLRSFYKPCSKKFRVNIWVPILVQRYKYNIGNDSASCSNLATMILLH